MISSNNMVLTDAGLFCEGMYIHAGVYYLYRGNYVLLCKDTRFTYEMVEKLKEVSLTHDGIYVYEDSFEEIWNESLRQFSRNAAGYKTTKQRVREEYDRIVSQTVNLLGGVMSGRGLSLSASENIVQAISAQTSKTEPAELLNCIHMIYQADDYLYTHCANVATLNGMIGKWLGLPEAKNKKLIEVGLLHDLGKLKIPSEILNKPGKLTDEEFRIIKHHPVHSYQIIRDTGYMDETILAGVYQHHERIQGNGYPDGVRGDEIHMAAHITAVSDVYDAMVSKRCYKDALTPFQVLDMLDRDRFSGLNIQVVDTFLENIIYLLLGTTVELSNGEHGEVVFIKNGDYANPIVKVGNRVISTNDHLKCILSDKRI